MPTEPSGGSPEGAPVLVGLIARAHGLRGEVVVEVWSDAPGRFRPGSVVRAGARTLRVAESRPFSGRLLVQFEGVETREDAEALRGTELTIDRSQVAPLPEGKHYRFELVGLEVRTTRGEKLGTVTDVFGTGSNDVLVVRDAEREILIPMLEGVVVSVDLPQRFIAVEPPPGLPGISEE